MMKKFRLVAILIVFSMTLCSCKSGKEPVSPATRTPEITEMLQNKANERNIPLDSMMILDIQWVIDREIENNELLFGNKRINLKNN